jgi:hypothetical protein
MEKVKVRPMPPGAFGGETDVEAVAAAEKFAAARSTLVTEESRDAFRAMVARAIREQLPADAVARLISRSIGLNVPQSLSALNYWQSLLAAKHTPETIDRLMGRYVDRKIGERAAMIARTETSMALLAGARARYARAVRDGELPRDARYQWVTHPSEGLCNVCRPMNGQLSSTIAAGGRFRIPGPPNHVNCKCTLGVTTVSGEGEAAPGEGITLAEIKRLNKAGGSRFFSKASLESYSTEISARVHSGPGGTYFVTSEQKPGGRRLFSVRRFDRGTGRVITVGQFQQWWTSETAEQEAARLATGRK